MCSVMSVRESAQKKNGFIKILHTDVELHEGCVCVMYVCVNVYMYACFYVSRYGQDAFGSLAGRGEEEEEFVEGGG